MKIEGNAHVLDMNVPQNCLYCVSGRYQIFTGGDQFRVTLVCLELRKHSTVHHRKIGCAGLVAEPMIADARPWQSAQPAQLDAHTPDLQSIHSTSWYLASFPERAF